MGCLRTPFSCSPFPFLHILCFPSLEVLTGCLFFIFHSLPVFFPEGALYDLISRCCFRVPPFQFKYPSPNVNEALFALEPLPPFFLSSFFFKVSWFGKVRPPFFPSSIFPCSCYHDVYSGTCCSAPFETLVWPLFGPCCLFRLTALLGKTAPLFSELVPFFPSSGVEPKPLCPGSHVEGISWYVS